MALIIFIVALCILKITEYYTPTNALIIIY